MNFFDPLRPALRPGQPAYLSPSGQPIGPLMLPDISPLPVGYFLLTSHLLIEPNVARAFTRTYFFNELGLALKTFVEDPEGTFLLWWGYEYEPPRARPRERVRPKIDLSQITLEF